MYIRMKILLHVAYELVVSTRDIRDTTSIYKCTHDTRTYTRTGICRIYWHNKKL